MTKSARSRKARRAEWEAAPGPWSDSEAEMLAATSYVPKKSSRNGALVFSVAVFVAAAAAVLACDLLVEGRISLVGILAALVAALAASSSLHIALGWEKVVVLRLGKLNRVGGGPASTPPFPFWSTELSVWISALSPLPSVPSAR